MMTMMEKAEAMISRKFEGTDTATFVMRRSGDRITVSMSAGTFSLTAESGSCIGKPEERSGMFKDTLAEYLLEYEDDKDRLDAMAYSMKDFSLGDMQDAQDVLQTLIMYGKKPIDYATAYGVPERTVYGMLGLAKQWVEYAMLHTKLFNTRPKITEFFTEGASSL